MTLKNLLIVESPTKARHISHMVGEEYTVIPTMGHILDLPKKEIGIDLSNGFKPQWVPVSGKTEIIRLIKSGAVQAEKIIIATDPDREGEGIAHHILCLIPKNQQKKVVRAEFMEITESGIRNGLNDLHPLNHSKAMAQQARRLVDRIVGFRISPMLWKELEGYKGLSAGRVQSAALKMIYDRQKEREAFCEKEQWNISSMFHKTEGKWFPARLTHFNGVDLSEKPICSQVEMERVRNALAEMDFTVGDCQKEHRNYSPPLPFVTATLLRAAASKYGYPAKKTMQLAQELFERGLITYMRTDSTRVSADFKNETRNYIQSEWGKEFISVTEFKGKKGEGIQDAHECIRPTSVHIEDRAWKGITIDHKAMYELIYNRYIMSQMASASHYECTVKINGQFNRKKAIFHGFSSRIVSPGWRILEERAAERYEPGIEDVEIGDTVFPTEFTCEQYFTKPPAQYTEITLIRTLETLGIGRPSTYVAIMDSLLSKRYVEKETHSLIVTELGKKVIEVLERVSPLILDAKFTAKLEKELDDVDSGLATWENVVENLYKRIESGGGKRTGISKSVVERNASKGRWKIILQKLFGG